MKFPGLAGLLMGFLLWSADGVRLEAVEPEVTKAIVFAKTEGRDLKLDLHRGVEPQQKVLIVYVHGGAWKAGNREDMPLAGLVKRGFTVASVDYRLTGEAPFPANVHDIKAAIRFLRANADELKIQATQTGIIGSSAGGHLAALVGLTNGNAELEGNVGVHLDQSSSVQAVISLFGASNLTTILDQSTEHGLKVRVPALQQLLGGQPREKPELARQASPVFHVDAKDPPVLLVHGDADPQMPIQQSVELEKACREAGVPVRHVVIPAAVHGGEVFYDEERTRLMDAFLKGLD